MRYINPRLTLTLTLNKPSGSALRPSENSSHIYATGNNERQTPWRNETIPSMSCRNLATTIQAVMLKCLWKAVRSLSHT